MNSAVLTAHYFERAVGVVRNDAVDAHIHIAAHGLRLVDRPQVYGHLVAMGILHEARRDDVERDAHAGLLRRNLQGAIAVAPAAAEQAAQPQLAQREEPGDF